MQSIPQHVVFRLTDGDINAVDEFLENLGTTESESLHEELTQNFSQAAVTNLVAALRDNHRLLEHKIIQSEDDLNKTIWSVAEDSDPIAATVHSCVEKDKEFFQFATSRNSSDNFLFLVLTQERHYELPSLVGGAVIVKKGCDGRMIEAYYYNDIDQMLATFMASNQWYDELNLDSIN
ncbi:MAG: hypothetical protein AAGA11_11830 [Pseudomonadota bacterium]